MKAEETVFRTIVDVPRWNEPMRSTGRFVLLGSCFAEHMGELFQSYGLNAVCNPLGVTYNPESVAIQVTQALRSEASAPDFLSPSVNPESVAIQATQALRSGGSAPDFLSPSVFHFDGLWRSWWAGSRISDAEEGRFRETIQGTFAMLGRAIREADWLFLTLGTNVCYRLRENGMTVANCHKVPAANFEEVTLPLEACTKALSDLMELLSRECPRLHVVFTVSPYRYRKYGFHGSQLAKATLLLAVDRVCALFPKLASYFPAYELLLDELRDYRFYADDMLHPAPAAVQYIWRRMTESCMDAQMQQYLRDYESVRKAKGHRLISIVNNL